MRRHDDGAAVEPGLDRRREAGHGGRVERGGRLVEQEDGRGAQQGAGEGDPLALARAQGEAVVAERGLEPGGQVGQQLGQADGGEHALQVGVVARRARRGAGSPPRSR